MYVGEYALPPVGRDQVRVGVKAAAINPLDWKLRRGMMGLLADRTFPKGMGSDFAGVVEAIGTRVTNVQVGDEVFGTMDFRRSGAFAENIVTRSDLIARKPPGLSFGEAACLPIPAATAWAVVLDKARTRQGSRLFIAGCRGAVGTLAVQLALAQGALVSGSCGSAAKESAKAAGVDPVFDYANESSYLQAGPFDAVFDTAGGLSVSKGMSMLGPVGVFIDINPTARRLVRGMLARRYQLAFPAFKYLPQIAALASEGKLRPSIGLEAPFGDALAVIANVEAGLRPAGRVVLTL